MANETIHIKPETHAKLKAIADDTGYSMTEILDQAVELLRRRQLLDGTVTACCYPSDRTYKKEIREETFKRLWDKTLTDGLEEY